MTALGIASLGAWVSTRELPVDTLLFVAAAAATSAMFAVAASLIRQPAKNLRWDGRAWHLGFATAEPSVGDISVAIDLGSWMLLRFTEMRTGVRSRVIWLPLQRRGLEPQWHALRCAVYSPRQRIGDDGSMDH